MVFIEEQKGCDLEGVKYQEYFCQLCFEHLEYMVCVIKLF